MCVCELDDLDLILYIFIRKNKKSVSRDKIVNFIYKEPISSILMAICHFKTCVHFLNMSEQILPVGS